MTAKTERQNDHWENTEQNRTLKSGLNMTTVTSNSNYIQSTCQVTQLRGSTTCCRLIESCKSWIKLWCWRIQAPHSLADNRIAGIKFLRGARVKLKMNLLKSLNIAGQVERSKKKQERNVWKSWAQKKWIKKDLLEESLSMVLVSQDRRKHDAVDMHCCETYTRSGGLAGWGGALLYLFRVGLLPLK